MNAVYSVHEDGFRAVERQVRLSPFFTKVLITDPKKHHITNAERYRNVYGRIHS